MLTPRELDAAQHIRHTIAGLQLELSLLRFELALKANFNPSQPRLPAGDPDGGQWTRVGGTGGAARRRNPPPSQTGSGRPGDAIGSVPARSQAQDSDATAEGWTVIGARTDGVVREETVVHRDGSAIRAEVSASPLTTGWDERYTVIGPDGTILTFQNRGHQQQVFDSNASLVAESRWQAGGATTEPTVQPVFSNLAVAALELGFTLFTGSRGGTRRTDRRSSRSRPASSAPMHRRFPSWVTSDTCRATRSRRPVHASAKSRSEPTTRSRPSGGAVRWTCPRRSSGRRCTLL